VRTDGLPFNRLVDEVERRIADENRR